MSGPGWGWDDPQVRPVRWSPLGETVVTWLQAVGLTVGLLAGCVLLWLVT